MIGRRPPQSVVAASAALLLLLSSAAAGVVAGRSALPASGARDAAAATPTAVSADATRLVSTGAQQVVTETAIVPVGATISGEILSQTIGVKFDALQLCRLAPAITNDDLGRNGNCVDGQTNADGTFSVGGLPSGTYILQAGHPFNSSSPGGFYGPGGFAASAAQATPIAVTAPGTVAGITVNLPSPLVDVVLSGKVTGVGGDAAGLAGVRIDLCPVPTFTDCAGSLSVSGGIYAVPGLQNQNYAVRFSAPVGSTYLARTWLGPNGTAVFDPSAAQLINPTTSGPINFAEITGHTWTGTLRTTTGAPINGATVSACLGNGFCVGGRTNKAGAFKVNGLQTGTWSLNYIRPTGVSWASGGWNNDGLAFDGFRLPAGFSIRSTDFTPSGFLDRDISTDIRAIGDNYLLQFIAKMSSGKAAVGVPVTACTPMYLGKPLPTACESGITDGHGIAKIGLSIPGPYIFQIGRGAGGTTGGWFRPGTGFVPLYPQASAVSVGTAVYPSVTNRQPKPGATNVSQTGNITFHLSDAVCGKATLLGVHLIDPSAGTGVPARATLNCKTDVLTLDPLNSLLPQHLYEAEFEGVIGEHARPFPPTGWTFKTGGKAQAELFTFTVTTSGSGHGHVSIEVSSSQHQDCPPDCTIKVPKGHHMSLQAIPFDGSTFGGWSGGGCAGVMTPHCELDVNGATTIDARFDPAAPAFKVAIGGRWFHNGPGDSSFFGCGSSTPALPGAAWTDVITVPSGATTTRSGTLDAAGKATFTLPINTYGDYVQLFTVTSGGIMASATTTTSVTSSQGSGPCQ